MSIYCLTSKRLFDDSQALEACCQANHVPAEPCPFARTQSRVIDTRLCPACRQRSLVVDASRRYARCNNPGCDFFHVMGMVVRGRDKMYVEYAKDNTEPGRDDGEPDDHVRSWFGNEYFDPRARKWRQGGRRRHVKLHGNYLLWYILTPVLVLITAAVLLYYFHPGSSTFWFPLP